MNYTIHNDGDRFEMIQEFLERLFDGADSDAFFIVQFYPGNGRACDNPGRLNQEKAFRVSELDDAVEFIQNNSEQDMYVTSTVFSEPHRKKDLAAQKRWIIAEFDDKGVDLNMSGIVDPTMIVESSAGKYHFYWDLGSWDSDVQEVGDINARFVNAHEFFDKGAKDLARVLRVPGTLHCKDASNIQTVNWTEDTGAVFALHDFRVVAVDAEVKDKETLPQDSDVSGKPAYKNYVERAIVAECDKIVGAADGEQNNQINESAFVIGTLMPWGTHDVDAVKERLITAGTDGGHPLMRTIGAVESGFTDGAKHAREIPVLDDAETTEKARVDVSTTHDAIENIIDAINSGLVPEIYVNNGRLVTVESVHGSLEAPRGTTPKRIAPLTRGSLTRLCQKHLQMYKVRIDKKTELPVEVVDVPSNGVFDTVLSETNWTGVRPILSVIHQPIVRYDGTLLATDGYDASTQSYMQLLDDYSDLNCNPTKSEFLEARDFLLNELLGDFPWKDSSDKANYVALLATPLLRDFVNGDECSTPTPLGAITAHNASSGKTLLADLLGSIYGKTQHPWIDSDDEMKKTITSVFASSSNEVVLFDNVERSSCVKAPVLANLLTSSVWSDRTLGKSHTGSYLNDRLWLITGNNVSFGGDMTSRTVLVRIDPNVPNPEERTGFTIPNLKGWIQKRANKKQVLSALITVILYWINEGASVPTEPVVMRDYTAWTEKMQGLTEFMGLDGFLGNRDELKASDAEADEWTMFLAKWVEKFGDREMKLKEIRDSATGRNPYGSNDPFAAGDAYSSKDDEWDGAFFLVDKRGLPFSSRALGDKLKQQVGNFHGDYVLRAKHHSRNNTWTYFVETV